MKLLDEIYNQVEDEIAEKKEVLTRLLKVVLPITPDKSDIESYVNILPFYSSLGRIGFIIDPFYLKK